MWKIKMAIGALLALKRLQMQAIKLVRHFFNHVCFFGLMTKLRVCKAYNASVAADFWCNIRY
jgi:hypothetical protein